MIVNINEAVREAAYQSVFNSELRDRLSNSECDEKADQLAREIQSTIDRWFALELAESDDERERIRKMFDEPELIFNLEHEPLQSLAHVASEADEREERNRAA